MGTIEFSSKPALRDPILVAAFRGWNDGGSAATVAAAFLKNRCEAKRFAVIDPDRFVDYQQTRPMVSIEDGQVRQITWPETEFFHARLPNGERDLLLVIGVEPNFRWREFSKAIADLAVETKVGLAVTLGGLLADTPHTRAIPVSGAAHDAGLLERFDDLEPVRYEGPTGIVGVLHDDLSKAGIPSASLWAAVPHYLGGNPNPTAALALVQALEPLVECELSPTELEQASAEFDRQIARVVEKDAEMRSYVTDLEDRLDNGDEYDDEDDDEDEEGIDDVDGDGGDIPSETRIPSGEEIAAELQEFLREQRDDN
ncbi:MAG: PAC2 family protein [Thermoleophilia bacterium]|nr:PAC2 family protein [Thermoleophilia bacterium]